MLLELQTVYNKQNQMMKFSKTLKSLDQLPRISIPSIPAAYPIYSLSNTPQNIYEHTSVFLAQKAIRQEQNNTRLMQMIQVVNLNTLKMLKLHQKIEENQESVDSLGKQLDSLKSTFSTKGNLKYTQKCMDRSLSETFNEDASIQAPNSTPSLNLNSTPSPNQNLDLSQTPNSKPDSPLRERIFGRQKYQFRLQVQGLMETTLYKEKNFNLKLSLVDLQGQIVMNSNIIHLCMGVTDASGEWVTENPAHQNILKGQTQTELYHGEAAFSKIYFREISRKYPGKTFNIVVYAKPSILQFINNNNAIEQNVNSSFIEPLILSTISVKSKKIK